MTKMDKLFTPFKKGSLKLKNHLVMALMTRSRAIGNLPNELMATYYAQRSGACMIVTEGTSPSPEGLIPGMRGYPGGKLLSIVVPPSQELAEQYKVKAGFVASDISAKTLQNGIGLVKAGAFKPVVSKLFKLKEAAIAQDHLTVGGVNGKVILTVD